MTPTADAAPDRRPAGAGEAESPALLPIRTVAIDRYLETIFCIATEGAPVRPSRVAHWLGVSAPTVSIGLRRLRAGGWISTRSDRGVTLTARGGPPPRPSCVATGWSSAGSRHARDGLGECARRGQPAGCVAL